MKDFLKVVSLVALCCIIIGAVFLAVGYANMDSIEQYYEVETIELNDSVSNISGINKVEIDIDLAMVNVVYEGDFPSIQGVVRTDEKYEIIREGDTLKVRVEKNSNNWYHNIDLFNYQYYNSNVTIKLPEKWKYEDMDFEISVGLGSIELERLYAGILNINVDMGTLDAKNLSANTVNATCGLGSIYLAGEIYESCDLDCDMGTIELTLDNATTRMRSVDSHVGLGSIRMSGIKADDVTANCDSGTIDIIGEIEKSCELTCGMGSINLRLSDSDKNWSAEQIDIGMGSVTYAGRSYDGLGRSISLPGGSKVMIIDVDMGTIDVSFKK